MATRSPRVYDHRIQEQVVPTGSPNLFPEHDIPRRTALSWIRRGARDVVTLDEQAWAPAYDARIAKLEQRVAMLSAILSRLGRCDRVEFGRSDPNTRVTAMPASTRSICSVA